MPEEANRRTWVDEVEVAGNQLIERIKDLIAEGNARRVIVKSKEGRELFSMPLTVGVVGGGIFTVAAPVWAAIGAFAALATQVKLEIIREEPLEKTETPEAEKPSTN